MTRLTSVTSYFVSVACCKTSFTFLCSKDFLRITDGMGKVIHCCGNKTGQNLLVTGDRVRLAFYSNGNIERGGYLLCFTLVSLSSFSSGKWDYKEVDKP